jgi:HAD superfamily hydrolase (TIGR01450 family)
LGIEAKKDDLILSTDGVINFLQQRNVRQVYAVGTKSMKEMFRQAGIETDSPNPRYIILGFDTELDYKKIKTASLLMQKEVEMIATHCDLVCPTPEGPIPDVGSMLALFETATQKKVARVFGKPHPEMVEFILNKHNVTPQEVIIIGDRIYTDMEMARQVGCDFVLVLSGETRTGDVQNLKNPPALVVETIGRLVKS